ncbi:unnamed protein product, partial [Brassica oleracea]
IFLYFIFFNLYKQVTLLKKKSKSRLSLQNFHLLYRSKRWSTRFKKGSNGKRKTEEEQTHTNS